MRNALPLKRKDYTLNSEKSGLDIEVHCKDRKQLEEMGRKGREFVIRNYSWDTIAEEIVDTYHEGIARYSVAKR